MGTSPLSFKVLFRPSLSYDSKELIKQEPDDEGDGI
jgi:hypothetical protein